MGCIGEGKLVLEERERGWFVGFEREEEREERFGGGAAMEDGGKKKGDGGKNKWRNFRFDYVW